MRAPRHLSIDRTIAADQKLPAASPRIAELLATVAACGLPWGIVVAARRWERRSTSDAVAKPVEV